MQGCIAISCQKNMNPGLGVLTQGVFPPLKTTVLLTRMVGGMTNRKKAKSNIDDWKYLRSMMNQKEIIGVKTEIIYGLETLGSSPLSHLIIASMCFLEYISLTPDPPPFHPLSLQKLTFSSFLFETIARALLFSLPLSSAASTGKMQGVSKKNLH